jgi:hypothetical protein
MDLLFIIIIYSGGFGDTQIEVAPKKSDLVISFILE